MVERLEGQLDDQIAELHQMLSNSEDVTLRKLAIANLNTLERLCDAIRMQSDNEQELQRIKRDLTTLEKKVATRGGLAGSFAGIIGAAIIELAKNIL